MTSQVTQPGGNGGFYNICTWPRPGPRLADSEPNIRISCISAAISSSYEDHFITDLIPEQGAWGRRNSRFSLHCKEPRLGSYDCDGLDLSVCLFLARAPKFAGQGAGEYNGGSGIYLRAELEGGARIAKLGDE